MSAPISDKFTVTFQRVENAFIAAAAVIIFVIGGFSWWWLLVLFLVFDLSMVGYFNSNKAGAISYNVVHNYSGPAILIALYAYLLNDGTHIWALGLIGGSWAFHVAVDRILGYGLKTCRGFNHTHLGLIGNATRKDSE